MNHPIVEIAGLQKSYDKNEVLKNIDMSLSEGTILGLVGRNGAGKTTLIKCILGLLYADSGEAYVFGESPRKFGAKTKHRIGYVPQVLTGLGWMTAGDLLEYTRCFYDHWNEEKVNSLVRDWNLDPYAKVQSMSEGEKQKLAIIQAMGHEPDLYIFDEPVASLDPLARRTFIRELIELNAAENKTMLFSTHITSDLERVAADVLLLKDGEIGFSGSLSTLKENVVRLHIQAKAPLSEPISIPGMVGIRCNGSQAVVTVENFDSLNIPALQQSLSASIRVEYLNLEEIFLELYQ